MTIIRGEETRCDTYIGEREELIAAGLVKPEQFPGLPGLRKTGNSFYDGKLLTKATRGMWDEKRISVQMWGLKFRVCIGVSAEVKAAREAKRQAAYEAFQRRDARPRQDEDRQWEETVYDLAIWKGIRSRRGLPFAAFMLKAVTQQGLLEGPRRPDATA